MEDNAKTYFATLVCSHPDGKAQAKCVRLSVIKISCTRSSARSLRSLRTLRISKEGLLHFEQIYILRVTRIYRTVIIRSDVSLWDGSRQLDAHREMRKHETAACSHTCTMVWEVGKREVGDKHFY